MSTHQHSSLTDIITHTGEDRSSYYNAIAPPIIQSSNFVFDTIDDMRKAFADELDYHIYTRGNNPTVEILRKKIAALEKTEDALITGSGAAAIATAMLANVQAGDHVICVQKPYTWTYKLISQLLDKFKVTYEFVDGRDIENIKKAYNKNTSVLYLESPNSLTFELQDLEACGKWAKENGVITMIDNSHCSPFFQNPADYGIDIILHSATKYINGHSDVVAGVICASQKMISKIFEESYMVLGTIISPHDASLLLRGLRTFTLRVEKSNETAQRLAEFLSNHPKIEKVIYPFHSNFEQYELARKQMRGAGGLITIKLNAADKSGVFRFINNVKYFLKAVSWGGYESLMMPSIVFHDIPGRPDSPIHWTYVRLYCGLEDYEILQLDLQKALDAI